MVGAIVVVPAMGYFDIGGIEPIKAKMAAKSISMSLMPAGGKFGVLAIVSASAWGLGYFGQPHILARFMSAKSLTKLKESMEIAVVWVFLSLVGAVVVGFIGIGMFDNLAGGEEEKVFIYMIERLFNPWVGGVMLAAILSAIMSTIDSQLLVSSSALAEDFYQKAIKKDASSREIIIVGRGCVILISVVALVLALRPNDTILGIVAYAWGGFGAAFGPLVLFALFSRKTTWVSALAGMIAGTVVLVVWKQVGLGAYLYEIVPGFCANCATICVINALSGQRDEQIIAGFDEVVKTMKS